MLKNYLIITLRTLRTHKGYAAINVLGLAVGTAACLLMLLYVVHERSYDRFHEQADRIYRVQMLYNWQGTSEETASVQFPVGPTLVRDVPGVEHMVRLHHWGGQPVLRHADRSFIEERFYFADPTFFEVFSVDWIQGDPATALTNPRSVVLTRATAQQYFGAEDPLGKTLTYENTQDLTVTGVVEAFPPNSHFHFDLLAPVELRRSIWRGDDGTGYDLETDWVWNAAWTYLVLADDEAARALALQLPDFVQRYYPDALRDGMVLDLIPLPAIHLHSHLDRELEANGNVVTVYVFVLLAFLVLLIACVNFTNMTTARSIRRAREVGVRKVLGAQRGQLIRQFLGEAVALGCIAMGIAILLLLLALPFFNTLTGKTLAITTLPPGTIVPALLSFVLLVGLLAGGYPAFYLAAFRPIHTLKSTSVAGANRGGLRKALVVGQFAISMVLLMGLGVMRNQLAYLHTKDLGFDAEQLVLINPRDEINTQFDAFREALLQHPAIVDVAGATGTLPGRSPARFQFYPEGLPREAPTFLPLLFVSEAFEETAGIELVAGRFFSNAFPADAEAAFVINEAAAQRLGWGDDPLGKRLERLRGDDNQAGQVIGVIRDFHFESLHLPVEPLILSLSDPGYQALLVKMRLDNLPVALDHLETTWAAFAPQWPLDYAFLDENLATFYVREERLHTVLQAFTLLALLIACLGLFGLASFTAEQRTKEIGVRKVLGASVANIVLLLSTAFMKLVGIAFVVAVPVAFFATRRWLDAFAYRVDVSGWTFLFAGSLALAIALLTVSYQAIKAAWVDPVRSLRYE